MKTTIKIFIPILLAPIALMSSCSDEPSSGVGENGRYILFDAPAAVTVTSQSRAMENSLTGDFKVYGYCAPQNVKEQDKISWENASSSWNSKSAYVVPRIFSGQNVDSEGNYALPGGGMRLWEAHEGYDENAYKYTFLAYYPAEAGFDMNKKYSDGMNIADAVGVPELTFTMPFAGGSSNDVLDLKRTPDAMWSAVFDHQKIGGPVRFTFRHLLTAFRFQVNNYTNLTLRVNKLKLQGNFYRSTTLKFETENVQQTVKEDDTYGGSFLLSDGAHDIGAQTGTSDIVGETLMLLAGLNPNRLPNYDYLGNNISMVIDYELYNPQDNSNVSSYTNVTAVFKPGQLRAGVRYTVNLNCLGNQFVLVFLPDTDNWEGDHDNDIIIN